MNKPLNKGDKLPTNGWKIIVITKKGYWGKGDTLHEAINNAHGTISLAALKRGDLSIYVCSDPDCGVNGLGCVFHSLGHACIEVGALDFGTFLISHATYSVNEL